MLGELDLNAMDAAQTEALRMLDLVRQKHRGTALVDRLWQDMDLWREFDPAGHRYWAQRGTRPDGTPYTLLEWFEEGRALAQRASDATGEAYDAQAFNPISAADIAAARRALRVSAIASAAAAGLGLLVVALSRRPSPARKS